MKCLLLILTSALLMSGSLRAQEEKKESVSVTEESTVVDSDGKQIELKLERKESSDSDNPDGKVQVSGTITVVGPDGKKTVIDLSKQLTDSKTIELDLDDVGGLHEELEHAFKGFNVQFHSDHVDRDRLMIGVMAEEAGTVLRSQLKLRDSGLLVKSVSDNTPAQEAGMVEGDILLKAGDVELKTVPDLLESVRKSEGKPVSFLVLHAGDETTIEVTPRKLPADHSVFTVDNIWHDIDFDSDGTVRSRIGELMKNGKTNSIRLHRVGPGIVIDRSNSIGKNPKEIRVKVRAEKAENEQKSDNTKESTASRISSIRKQLHALQQQLDEVENARTLPDQE